MNNDKISVIIPTNNPKNLDNKYAKILFFIIGIINNARRYYIKSILKKFKMI